MPTPSEASPAAFPNNLGGGTTGIPSPVLNLWVRRRQRSQELKQRYEPEWVRYWKWYRAVIEPLTAPEDWWRSNEIIPTVFKIIETLLPRYLMGIFDSPDWFTVEARQSRDEMYEHMCTVLIRNSIEEMRLFPKLYEAMKYSLIMGHAWGKVTWREEYTMRQVLVPSQQVDPMSGEPVGGVERQVLEEEEYNGVDFDWRPLDRIFPDPTGEGQWYIEEIDTTMEKLQESQKLLDVYDPGEFARLMSSIPPSKRESQYGGSDSLSDASSGTSAGVSVEYAREPERTEGIPNYVVSPMRDGIGVKLWQCWGWVPPDFRKSDKSAWRLTVIAEGRYILRDEPSPTPDGKPPYFPIKAIPVPGVLYGESPIHYVGPLADQQTRLANMRLDEVYLGIWQQFLYKKGAVVSDNAMLMQPGGAIQVNTELGQGVGDVFAPLERPQVLPDAYTEDDYRQTQAEHAVAASDIMQGVGSAERQTATEVERRLQQGNARHMLQVLWNDYTVKKELCERTWKWLQSRLTQPKFIRIVGEEYAQVDYTQIQVPIDIVVSGGLFALSKDTRVQMSQELVQMSASPVFSMWMRPGAILRRYLEDRGWKNPESFIKSDQEVMLEQVVSQMGAGAAAGGAPPPGQKPGGEGAASRGPGGKGGADNGAQAGMPNMQSAGEAASMVGGQAQGNGSPLSGPG